MHTIIKQSSFTVKQLALHDSIWALSMSNDAVIVELTQSPTELYKILKFEGLVASGAQAKQAIADGLVSVNGETETRKRKKIIAGDKIQFLETLLTIS
jgi:ribosome-associated protein